MKYFYRFISIILLVSILATLSACVKKSETNQTADSTEKVNNGTPEQSKMIDDIHGNDIEKTKRIRELMPRLVKDVKTALITDSERLWPDFNNNDKQILLISPSNDVAYLINNQNAELGSKEDEIEYSTQSLYDINKTFMIQTFGYADFNGYNTYFVNVDQTWFLGGMDPDPEMQYVNIFKFVIHEGVHILLQSSNETTGENGLRADQYPFDVTSRYYRNETYTYLKEAAFSKNSTERAGNIKKAINFHEKYLAENKKNPTMNIYDSIEGLATFIEDKAWHLIKNPDAKENELLALSKKSIIDNIMSPDKDKLFLDSNREFYDIGALAIAVLIDTGEDISKTIFSNSPLELMKSKFGSEEAKGHNNIKDACIGYYTSYNNKIKAAIDEIEKVKNDESYVAVRIPVTANNGGMIFEDENIEYTYKNQLGMIQTATVDLVLGSSDTRVKLNRAMIISQMNMGPSDESSQPGDAPALGDMIEMNPNMVIQEFTIFVPKKDVKISKDNLLTIQRDDIIVFDATFELKDGEYTLLIK